MIGVANDIDLVNVNNTFGQVNNCVLGYGYDPIKDKLLDRLKNSKNRNKKESDSFRILIGHSASVWDKHIDVMKNLLKYKRCEKEQFFIYKIVFNFILCRRKEIY